jgi:hypothetical protein
LRQEVDIWNIYRKVLWRAECHRQTLKLGIYAFPDVCWYKLFLLSTYEELIPEVMSCFLNTLYIYADFSLYIREQLSAVVFGKHVRPILTLVFFSSGVLWRTKFTTVTPERKN